MRFDSRFAVGASLLAVLGGSPALPADAPVLSPGPGEVAVGPIAVSQPIQGVPVTVNATSFIDVSTDPAGFTFSLRLLADLGDLQAKVGAIVDTAPLPTDNCSRFGADNVVARVWGKQLLAAGDSAILKLKGDVDVWTCAKNPVPCTRVDWVDKDGPFGIKIRVPEVRVYECNSPIKNRNLNQPFEATLPITLGAPNAKTLAVQVGPPSVNLGGSLGGVTHGILRIAGVDLNAKAKAALDEALSPQLLQRTIPPEYLQLAPEITGARLLESGGSLTAEIRLEAKASGAAVTGLLQQLVAQPKVATR